MMSHPEMLHAILHAHFPNFRLNLCQIPSLAFLKLFILCLVPLLIVLKFKNYAYRFFYGDHKILLNVVCTGRETTKVSRHRQLAKGCHRSQTSRGLF